MTPVVSVLVANFNGAATIGACLRSILAQTLREIEVLVIDDASTDDSTAIVAAIAARDPRVRLFAMPANGGPAAARNLGLDQARGRWIAVVDSDDLIHPQRLARLVTAADAAGVEIAADNLLVFDDANASPPYAFMNDAALPRAVSLVEYVEANIHGAAGRKLGYLKPMFNAAFVRRSGVRYPTTLRIAEDFGFVLGLMGAGARFHLFPGMTYFYRKHVNSISHRLQVAHVTAMLAEDSRFIASQAAPDPALTRAFARRRNGFAGALEFEALVQALKARRWAVAAATAMRRPRAAAMLRQPLAARLKRRRTPKPLARPQVCMIGGGTPARLARLARLAASLARDHDVHLVTPAALLHQQRSAAFASVTVRTAGWHDWTVQDQLFVARAARPKAGILITEWQPKIDVVPFVLRPDALSLLVWDGQPPGSGVSDQAGPASSLARADAVLAFSAADAAAVRVLCADTTVMLLPGAVFNGAAPGDARLRALADTLTSLA